MADRKTNYPDSDETARQDHSEEEGMKSQGTTEIALEGQTSNKSGKHSSVEKLAGSRPGFGQGRGAVPVDGAFGDDPDHVVTGRNAGPNTNQFRCESCGRWFNTKAELDAHSPECQLAKAATAAGRPH
jgi:hypothetical protein